MKTKTMISLVTAVVVAFLAGNSSFAEEKDKMPEDMQAMMAKAKEAGSPSAGHEVLKSLEGEWNTSNSMWMNPGDKPEVSTGTSMMEWIFDGRFLKQKFKGEWMGEKFEGIGLLGYDNVTKQYQSLWIDNMSTAMVHGVGSYNKGSKTITQEGTFSCPIAGKEMPYRSEWKIMGKNKNVFSWYVKDPDGKEYKSMEITYTRR